MTFIEVSLECFASMKIKSAQKIFISCVTFAVRIKHLLPDSTYSKFY